MIKLNKMVVISTGSSSSVFREQSLIATNFSSQDIATAYRDGCELIGLDICKITNETNILSENHMELLGESNFEFTEDFMQNGRLSSDDAFDIFMHTIKAGNSLFFAKNVPIETIDIECDAILEKVN
jgi:hypothetical protein